MNTPDCDDWHGRGVPPGSPPLDAPLAEGWLLERLGGEFVLVTNGPAPADLDLQIVDLTQLGASEQAVARYGLAEGGAYAQGLDKSGTGDKRTLRPFDVAWLGPATPLPPNEINPIRATRHVSQPPLARCLNVSKNLVPDWERWGC